MRVRAEADFRVVFDRLFDPARGLARRITGDSQAAEEAAAEALTRLYVRWGWMAGRSHVDAWVMRVTANLAIDECRRRARVVVEPLVPASDDSDGVPDRVALVRALAALPRRQREVVTLRYLVDLSEADVAEVLRVSTGSVKTHLSRGLERLRSDLAGSEDVEVDLAKL